MSSHQNNMNEEGGGDYNSGMYMSNTTTIPPTSYRITYNYDNNSSNPSNEEEFIQPHTTPVAHFTSQVTEEFNQLIDISTSFIVYAVKNNLVRVIDRRNALRTLLRGHEGSPVTCLKFFNNKSIKNAGGASDVLATVGGGGNDRQTIFVWRLYCSNASATGGENEIISEKLLEIKFDSAKRILWHPTNPNQLLIVSDSLKKTSVFIETTRLVTAASNTTEGAEGNATHAVCACREKDLGNAVNLANGDVVVDVDWNEYDSKYALVAVEHEEEVQLWDLTGWGVGMNSVSHSVHKIGTGVKVPSVSQCLFVNHKKGSFITGCFKNKEITLWSSFLDHGGASSMNTPMPLQVWRFASSISPPPSICFNVAICPGGNDSSAYLLLADKNKGHLFAIHLEDDRFTSFSPFSVVHPVVSWSAMSTPSISAAANSIADVDVCLFCVQSKAVQMLRLKQKMLASSSGYPTSSTPMPTYLSIETQAEVMMLSPKVDHNAGIQEYEDDEDYDYSDGKEEDVRAQYVAPPATALPPPGLRGFSSTGNGNDAKHDAFSNWLGSLAATSEGKASVSSTSNILPKADPVPSNPKPIAAPTNTILRTAEDSKLLSPTRFITSKVAVEEEKIPTILKKVDPPKKEEIKEKTTIEKERGISPPARNTKPEKAFNNNQKSSNKASRQQTPTKKSKGQHHQPIPNSPPSCTSPQIKILKREDNPPPPAPSTTTSSNNIPVNTTPSPNMEELTRKLFKKQEVNIQNEIQRSIRQETQTMLVPSLTRSLTLVMHESITKPLKETIQRTKDDDKKEKLKMKEMGDILVEGVQTPIVDAFHQTMREVMIPAFEAATQQMFSQISSSLEQQLLTSQKASKEKTLQISSLESKMDSMSIALASLSVEVTHLRTQVTSLSDTTKSSNKLDEDVKTKQVTKEDLLVLLNSQSYEEAFTKALSASSAEMAVYCCINTNSSILFETKDNDTPSLSQPILLCLMQQLGSVIPTADTTDLMEVLSWLQDICVVLEPTNKNIQNHIADVLRQLIANIKVKMAEGDMTFRRPLQMLLQVIRGIGIV